MPILVPPYNPGLVPRTFNFKQTNMRRWRNALARMRRGQANAKLGISGDSIKNGRGALGGTTPANTDRLNGSPAQLANRIAANGDPVMYQSVWCSGATNAPDCSAVDSRLTAGASWVPNPSPNRYSFGGQILNAASAGTLSWTPKDAAGNNVAVDTFVLYYPLTTVAGTFTYQVDAGGTTLVTNTNGTDAVTAPITISAGSLASHTLNLAWVSGTATIIGIEAYNSAQKCILVRNGGMSTGTAAYFSDTTRPWRVINYLPTLANDLLILSIGLQDLINTDSPTTIAARLDAIVKAQLAVGDCILESEVPIQAQGGATLANQAALASAIYGVALANDIPFIDTYNRWEGSFALFNASPYLLYSDTVHPNQYGYSDIAGNEYRAIMNPF